MQKTLSGKLSYGDGYRVYEDDKPGAVHIGDVDFFLWADEFITGKEGEKIWFSVAADFLIGDTTWDGIAQLQQGWGYSEYTPIDADEFFVGPHDILAILRGHEDKDVTVWIADEPLNLLAGVHVDAG